MKEFWKRVWGWFFVDDSELRAAIAACDQAKADYFAALRQLQSDYQEATQAPFDAVEECKKQIQDQDAKIKDLEKQLEEKKKHFQELLQTSKDQSSQADRLLEQIKDNNAKIQGFEDQNTQLWLANNEHAKTIKDLEKQIQDKDAQIKEQSQSIVRLTTDKTNLAREKLVYFRRLAKIRHEVGQIMHDEPETATAQGGGA